MSWTTICDVGRGEFDEVVDADFLIPIESGLKPVRSGERSALHLDEDAVRRIIEKFSEIEEALERAMRRLREPSTQGD